MSETLMFNQGLYYRGKYHKGIYYDGCEHRELRGNYEETTQKAFFNHNWWELTPTLTFTYSGSDGYIYLVPLGVCAVVFNNGKTVFAKGNYTTKLNIPFWCEYTTDELPARNFKSYKVDCPEDATSATVYGKLIAADCKAPVEQSVEQFYHSFLQRTEIGYVSNRTTSPPIRFYYLKHLTLTLLNPKNIVRGELIPKNGSWDSLNGTYSGMRKPGISMSNAFFDCQFDEFPVQFFSNIAHYTDDGTLLEVADMYEAFRYCDFRGCGIPQGALLGCNAWNWKSAFEYTLFDEMPEMLFGGIIPANGGFMVADRILSGAHVVDYDTKYSTPKRLFSDNATYKFMTLNYAFAGQLINEIQETLFEGIPEKTYAKNMFNSQVYLYNIPTRLLKPVAESGADILTHMFSENCCVGYDYRGSNLGQAVADGLFGAWHWKHGLNAFAMFRAYMFAEIPVGAFAGVRARRAGRWDDVDLGLEHGGYSRMFCGEQEYMPGLVGEAVKDKSSTYRHFAGFDSMYNEIMAGYSDDDDMSLYESIIASGERMYKIVPISGTTYDGVQCVEPDFWKVIRLPLKQENGKYYAKRCLRMFRVQSINYDSCPPNEEVPYLYCGTKDMDKYGKPDSKGYVEISQDEYNRLRSM